MPATWTDPDEPGLPTYRRSKVLSELAAWEFAAEHPELELTTILPGSVFGPARSAVPLARCAGDTPIPACSTLGTRRAIEAMVGVRLAHPELIE